MGYQFLAKPVWRGRVLERPGLEFGDGIVKANVFLEQFNSPAVSILDETFRMCQRR